MTNVWSVNIVYSPWISHGYEPVAFFSTEAKAEAYRDKLVAESGTKQTAEPEKYGYGYEVEEWEVDPDV